MEDSEFSAVGPSSDRSVPIPTPYLNFEAGLLTADRLNRRFKRRGGAAVIRNGFVVRDGIGSSERLPPMAQILQSGRGSDIRLKLALSLLWGAVAKPYDTREPPAVWASLIGLGTESNAVRQIRSALKALEAMKLIEIQRSPGHLSGIQLLNERGEGDTYGPPNPGANGASDLYIRLPNEFWTRGWVQVLSARAIATFLGLLYMTASRRKDATLMSILRLGIPEDAVWLSLDLARKRLGLSEDTRYRGLSELRDYGLVSTSSSVFSAAEGRQQRVRDIHVVNLGRLAEVAPAAALEVPAKTGVDKQA